MGGTKSSGNKSQRTRNWTFVLYPDSAPENWTEQIDELHIEWIESPLHEFDTNPGGEVKKAHKHILMMFGGMKTYEQVAEITEQLNSTIPQRCLSVKGTVRYMAHLDNPEKFQYSPSDIKQHGGVDLAELLKPSSSERYELIKEMCQYIKENDLTEFQDLMDYSMLERFDSWFPLLCDNSAFVIGQYIKSQRHRREVKA